MPQGGAVLALAVTPRLQLGGGARFDLTAPTIVHGGSRVLLQFGYAGLTVGVVPAPRRWPGLRVRALLGAGNASSKDPAIGTVLDSDNGVVVEPSVDYGIPLGARVRAAGSVSWRYADGFSVLGGVRSRDLRGGSVGLALSVGPF